MTVKLKFGFRGLYADLPETPRFCGVLSPSDPPPLPAPEQAVAQALDRPIRSAPLRDLAAGRKSACVVISDITRPVPNALLLPPILEALEESGVPRDRILILIATGTHRPNEGDEMIRLVGPEIAARYRVENHFCKQMDEMRHIGTIGQGVPVSLNRKYLDSDLKILTGFIEPHMWAGFSGGRKAILPGISSIETVKYLHGPEMVAHPRTTYGAMEGNPFHEAALAIMEKAGADFIVNVTLNTEQRLTSIFAGHPIEAHQQGCEFLARYCIHTLSEPLDFIVTTNSGAPLDCNLYQTIKGMAAAAPALKPGGVILIASACFEGIGNPEFEQVVDMADTPENFLARLMRKEFFIADQWCAQEIYQVMRRNPTWIFSEGIACSKLEQYHFRCVESIEAGVAELLNRFGRDARWAVVPDGPALILKTRSGGYGHK